MRNDLMSVALFLLVLAAATATVRCLLCADNERDELVRILTEHAPLLEKDKERVVLLYPASAFSEIIVGMNLPQRRLLPVPDRFSPVDYRAITSFGNIWLITRQERPPRPFEKSFFSIEKIASSERFVLYRLTPPPHLTFTDFAGGTGGNPFSLFCRSGTSPQFISFASPKKELAALQVFCRDSQGGEKEQKTFGDPRKATQTPLDCPPGAAPSGMTLSADHIVRGITLHCTDGTSLEDGRKNLPSKRLFCPPGTSVKGIFGSSGALVDALGLVCGK